MPETIVKNEEVSLNEQIVASIREIWRLGRNATNAKKKENLTVEQFWILRFLSDAGPRRIKDIAEHIGTTSSPVTISVKRLEKLDLVRRERGKSDERVVTVHLTDHGRAVFEARRQERREVLSSLFNALDMKEKARLNDLLAKVLVNSHKVG